MSDVVRERKTFSPGRHDQGWLRWSRAPV